MRRHEKEITDRGAIDAIIRASQVCRLGFCDGVEPYVVPVCFGYDGEALYFHGAAEGRKIETLRKNPRVCFEFDRVLGIIEAGDACCWGIEYQSVIGFGTAEILADPEEKRRALVVLMSQYSDRTFSFSPDFLELTSIIQVKIETVTGKQSGSRRVSDG